MRARTNWPGLSSNARQLVQLAQETFHPSDKTPEDDFGTSLPVPGGLRPATVLRMISLKPYLFGDKGKNADGEHRRIIGLFLQGIALHAVEGDQSDYGPFRADIDEFAKQITPFLLRDCYYLDARVLPLTSHRYISALFFITNPL